MSYHYDKHFENQDYTNISIAKGEYENCTFTRCNFSAANLAECKLIDCTFEVCNLSLANITGTVLRDVTFNGCKLTGIQFDNCSEFGLSFSFSDCQLNHCSFFKRKIKKTRFIKCNMTGCDFTEADISGSSFERCDLSQAIFDQTDLRKCDLRTAFGFSIDPEKNYVKKLQVNIYALPGLLSKYDLDISQG